MVNAGAKTIEGTIVWTSGAQTPLKLWRRAGLDDVVRERHALGMTVAEIRTSLIHGDQSTGQKWRVTKACIYGKLRRLGLQPHRAQRDKGLDRGKLEHLHARGLTMRQIAAQLNGEGLLTPTGRTWTDSTVFHWLGRRGRRNELEGLHLAALEDAKRRGLSDRDAASEFNVRGVPRVGRRTWTADAVRQRRTTLNRRRRRMMSVRKGDSK